MHSYLEIYPDLKDFLIIHMPKAMLDFSKNLGNYDLEEILRMLI